MNSYIYMNEGGQRLMFWALEMSKTTGNGSLYKYVYICILFMYIHISVTSQSLETVTL